MLISQLMPRGRIEVECLIRRDGVIPGDRWGGRRERREKETVKWKRESDRDNRKVETEKKIR